MSFLLQTWSALIDWISGHAIVPLLQLLRLDALGLDSRGISAALLIALLQLGLIALVFRPLETLWPAEPWPDRKLTRVDRNYTVLMLLGIFPLFSYLILLPLGHFFGGADPAVSSTGSPLALTRWLPWLDAHPVLLFAVYYAVYDLTYYWLHRVQHWIPWWWAMHSMHHSTRQMSCWANDRGSLLDGFLQSMVLATVGIVMGVDPEQFALLMLLGELVQNLSHTNTRLGFGRIGERLLVSPGFHRLHHMVVDPQRPQLHNCNFGQVFSIWDNLFGTALYDEPVRPTGVGDPVVDADNGLGIIGLQWVALRRFWASVWCKEGWRPGEVSFAPGSCRPIPVSEADLHQFAPAPGEHQARATGSHRADGRAAAASNGS